MKLKSLLRNAVLVLMVVTTTAITSPAATVVVSGDITTNTTWSSSNIYILSGYVYVTNDATLTIQAGTIIKGDSSSLGSLIITRGANIIAIGTACKPIVFTSEQPAGQRDRGDWGGLIILGYAQLNTPGDTAHIEGIVANPKTLYGGGKNPNCGNGDCPDNNDNSGTLQYVRIEFAGIALAPNQEINGLTLGGVGSGTTIDHVQVSYANDDAFEFFGGTVNARHLVAYRTLDDDFDTDFGYTGKLQFLVSLRDPNVADVSTSNGFESDNDSAGSGNLPQTSPVFSNVTSIAGSDSAANPLFGRGAHIRRNSHMWLFNSISMGWPKAGLLIDGAGTQTNVTNDTMVENNIIAVKAAANYVLTASPSGATSVIDLLLLNAGNDFFNGNAGVMLADPYNLSDPDFQPNGGSPALGTSDFSDPRVNDPFFTSVSYRGAFDGTNDWTGDWANWNPVNAPYGSSLNYTPTITGITTQEKCPGSGAVNINVGGNGVPPYSYSWSNGEVTEDISNVAAGTYVVTVYDEGGQCSANKQFKVKAEKPLFTGCTPSSTSITLFWSSSFTGVVTGYQVRQRTVGGAWGPWTSAGTGTSTTRTGLLSNTAYQFQLRGICSTNVYTARSANFNCSTTLRLADVANGQSLIVVYPNPNDGQMKVEWNGFSDKAVLSLSVINVVGEEVYTASGIDASVGSVELNLGEASNGLYQVIMTDGVKRQVQNIILNK